MDRSLPVLTVQDGGVTWSDIAGATGTSYTPPAGSAGEQVQVAVTATNGDGSAQATSPASAVILANPPVNTVAPTLSGTAQAGTALTAVDGTWSGMVTIAFAYQWQQSADGGATWSNIATATGTSYTPPAASAGSQVRVQVTATNGDGSSQAVSPASTVTSPSPPAPPSPPRSTSPTASTQPLALQPSTPVSSPSTQSGAKPAPKPTRPKAKPKSKPGITRAPWSKPLSFNPTAGWHAGTSGTVRTVRNSAGKVFHLRYPESIAWTANVPYRDPATADPPQRTVYELATSGIVVTAVIKPPSHTTQRLSLDLRNARPFTCCDGTPSSHTRGYELVGVTSSRRYEAIIDVYFGTKPTARLWAQAQQAVRRIQLPRGR